MNALVFVLSLPLAVWALASLFCLIDIPDPTAAIVRISTRCLAVGVFIYLVGPHGRMPVLWGFATVIMLHLSLFSLTRWLVIHCGFNARRID